MLQIGESREVLVVAFQYPEPEPVAPPPSLGQLKELQELVGECPQVECPVQHFFAPGLYTRQCTIPAGTVVVGKMHRHRHPTFLMAGTCRINTDKGMQTITGPHIWISQENAKRALVTLTDCVFATVHLNPADTTDLAEIEAAVIVSEAQIPYESEAAALELANDLQRAYA